jgi:molecular chaperone GrpE
VEGVELVIKQIGRVLEAHGVKRVETVGKMFDPHVHEAVAHINSDRPEETIIEETEPGFLLHDRLIHPAKVIVSKGPLLEGGNKNSVSKSGEAPIAEAKENESKGS